MTKSHASELSKVYDALFEDLSYTYPTLRAEFGRDRARLAATVASRGVGVYYTDLPALGKHLDRCLSIAQYVPSGLTLSKRVSRTVQIPKFLRGLYLLVFDSSGAMKENCDVYAICCLRQVYYLAKKAKADCSDHDVRQEVGRFVDVDVQLPDPESFWSGEAVTRSDVARCFQGFRTSAHYERRLGKVAQSTKLPRSQLSTLLANLDIVSGLLASFLGPVKVRDWKHRHGPGAVSDPVKSANKYAFRNWSPKLEREFPYADVAFHSYAAWVRHVSGQLPVVSSNEPYSKLIAVPKTYTKPRLIAAEPSEHQWCQQSLKHYFYSRVAQTWISEFVQFSDQTLNQRLCRRASQDGTLITVDLSAASDRVSCHFVGQLFRGNPELLLLLQSSRTTHCWIPFGQLDGDIGYELPTYRSWPLSVRYYAGKPGWLLPLKKFSTMGSACTFPVESLGFLAIALASVLTARGLRPCLRNILRLKGEVAVFGDDIIAPEDSRELLFGALSLLDFEVNLGKTYWNGLFRESCGLDAYAGTDVSPAYWRAPNDGEPESIASTIEVSNNFYQRFFVKTAECIARTVRGVYPLVSMRSGVLGLKSFLGPDPATLTRRRWNTGLQRFEIQLRGVTSKQEITPIQDETALLQFFTERPDPMTHWTGGVRSVPKHRKVRRWVPEADLASSC